MESKPKPKVVKDVGDKVKIMSYQIPILTKWILSVLVWAANVIVLVLMLFMKTISRFIHYVMDFLPKAVSGSVSQDSMEKLDKQMVYAGLSMKGSEVLSITLVYSTLFAILGSLISIILEKSTSITITIMVGSFLGVWMILPMILNLLTYRRTESVENALPDVLDMISQNMVVGMTTYNAMWIAARPEFGPLAEEIQNAAKDTLAGTPLEDALSRIPERIRSDNLERSIKLILQGLKSGGELPAVLQGVARDIRTERNLRKQMVAETTAYALFILFTLLIGAPLLFAISLQFITVFTKLFEETGIEELSAQATGTFMTITKISISPGFFLKYSVSVILSSAFFGAFLLGLIKTGKPISGMQNVPILVVVALTIFFTMNYVFSTVFSKMLVF